MKNHSRGHGCRSSDSYPDREVESDECDFELHDEREKIGMIILLFALWYLYSTVMTELVAYHPATMPRHDMDFDMSFPPRATTSATKMNIMRRYRRYSCSQPAREYRLVYGMLRIISHG